MEGKTVAVGFCPNCGVQWAAGAAVCGSCGFIVQDISAPPLPPPPVAEVVAPAFAPSPFEAVGPVVAAPALEFAAPVEGATPVPPPAAQPRPSRRKLAIGAGLVGLGIVAVGLFLVLGSNNPQQMPVDLVTRVAARDVSAAKLLASEDDLRVVADGMGLVGVPKSVEVTVENLKVVDATPSAAPSGNAGGDRLFKVTYTLKLKGPKGAAGSVDQTLMAMAIKGKDGATHLANVTVTPALVFDASAYFGSTGTSESDATKVAADLRAGTAWIPGLTVTVSTDLSSVSMPDVETPVPGHLASWHQTVSPAVVGSRTTWAVHIAGSEGTFATLYPASTITLQPVPAQVKVGAVSEADAIAAAHQLEVEFDDAINSGNVALANSMLTPGGPRLTASGLAAMKGRTPTADAAYGDASEGDLGAEVQLVLYRIVLGSDGNWAIDSARSNLIVSALAGNGHAEYIIGSVKNPITNALVCKINITIKLVRVEFASDGSARGVFSFATTGGVCVMNDSILAATVGWKGQSGIQTTFGVAGTDTTVSSVLRFLILPQGATADLHPIWIKITRYGTEGGAILPYAMTFTTK